MRAKRVAGCRCADVRPKHDRPWLSRSVTTSGEAACDGPAQGRLTREERETGLEPATACLEGRNSTTELLPHQSGCADSNRGPPGPKPGALPTAPHPAECV